MFRSVPWFLWTPVRRGGWFGTLCVALAGCLIQAGIELTAAKAIRSLLAPDAAATLLVGLALVLSSLFLVSFLAAYIRPGAGTLLTPIAIVAVSVQWVVKGPLGLSLSHMVVVFAAPFAAFAGSALSLNVRKAPRME